MKVFIDASAYLSILLLNDINHQRAINILKTIKDEQLFTSYAVIGEVLTVSSQRYDRQKGLKFIEDIIDGTTNVVYENVNLIKKTLQIFKKIKNKNVSWVDCYSFAIIEEYKIEKAFSFDRDFRRYTSVKVLTQ